MNWFKRLWWRITRSRQGYVEKLHDQRLVEELNIICLFFGLRLEETKAWDAYDIPYNPIGSLTLEESAMDNVCRIRNTVDRRHQFFWLLCSIGDIEASAVKALQCTPEWHEFNDWLHDR